MSLLSPELRIALLPGRAALAVGGRAPATAGDGPGWEGAQAGLDRLLDAQKKGGRAAVTLSHHFVRLFLVDPPSTWLRRAEMQSWLAERLAGPLGGREGWRLVWQPAPPGRPMAVCAIESAHLEDLQALLARHACRAVHLRPWLDVAWARRHGRLARVTGWYVLLEPGSASLMHLRRGRIELLRQRQIGEDAARDLAALLHREALLAGEAGGGEVWLERTGVSGDWQGLGPGWQVRELAGPTDPALALLQ